MPDSDEPDVTVVIPVFDDYRTLRSTLEALEHQTYPSERYEILVVDNGTPSHKKSDPSQIFERVTQITEPEGGSYTARNAGIEASNSELLAFTDADCLPVDKWLEAGVEALTSDNEIGLVGGELEIFTADSGVPTAAETWEMRRGFPQRHYIEDLNFAATANMFTRRSVFHAVGRFDGELESGGDREFGERVAAAGYRQVFAPEALVRHPARSQLRDLIQKTVRTTRGDFQRRENRGEFDRTRRLWRMLRAAGDVAISPLNVAWTAAREEGPVDERLKFALVEGVVGATREIVAIEQLVRRLDE
jgi:GT2 family glycosyltransferase